MRNLIVLGISFFWIFTCPLSYSVEIASATKEFIYKTIGERELKLIVDYPPDWKKTDNKPVMVFFFGGGWNGGRITHLEPQAKHFAQKGIVCVRPDYRVKSRDNVTPNKCVEDARSAVRWIRSHHEELGIDPKKFIASGGSAGGHLAACTMIEDCVDDPNDDLSISTVPQAMVLFNPVMNTTNEKTVERLNGNKELAQKISPNYNVNEKSPPSILMYGSLDTYKWMGDEYWEKAEELGIRADQFIAEGEKHAFFNKSPWLERTIEAAEKFLISLGYIEE
jgi:acetyl esterase